MPRKIPPSNVTDLPRRPVDRKATQAADTHAASLEEWSGTLRILVFATDEPGHAEGSAPFAIIPEAAAAFLPQHPGGFEWRYFATMRLDDQMLSGDRAVIEAALHDPGYYISDRPLSP
jgi:hypothetical protein